MSALLYVVGATAVMAGAVMVAFGIPINEFSFGNTLIATGAMAVVGGITIFALGAVVHQLHRVVEALATRPPLRAGRPMELFEQPAAPRGAVAQGSIPFPPKPKTEPREPHPAEPQPEVAQETPHSEQDALTSAPMLQNPDEAPVAVEESEDLSLSSHQQQVAAKPAIASFDNTQRSPSFNGGGQKRLEQMPDTGWRAVPPPQQPQTSFFETMWPTAAARPSRSPADGEPKPETKFKPKYEAKSELKPARKVEPELKGEFRPEPKPESEPKPEAISEAEVPPTESETEFTAVPVSEPAPPPGFAPETEKPRPANEPRAVAILKSGVVDGMGYTLYVDGSIEAELPQGTLRFASINELRSHLEKNS